MKVAAAFVVGLGVFSASASYGEIVYSGPIGDSATSSSGPVTVEIAGNEYQFAIVSGGPVFFAGITANNDGAGLFVTVSNLGNARNFNAGNTIGTLTEVLDMYPIGSGGGANLFAIMHDYASGAGNFSPDGTGYVGFGFGGPINFNYGWMRFTLSNPDVPALRTVTIVDWAYESNLNQSIEVGAIPAPGAIAVAALAGLASRRRRR